jgi:hypothetical protein
MLEQAIYDFVVDAIPDADITWGKLDADTVFTDMPIINFIKVPGLADDTTPSYLDNIQFTVRHEYIDVATQYMNKIIELFQLYAGEIGSYLVRVPSVIVNGTLYEEEDIVAASVTVGIKYTKL